MTSCAILDQHKRKRVLLKNIKRAGGPLPAKDWDDVRAARKEFKTGKSVAWRTVKRD